MKLAPKLLLLIVSATCACAATNPPAAPLPVPRSPYLPRIYQFVDALLQDQKQTTSFHHHQNLLRLLYTLTELSTKSKYRDAADAAVRSWLAEIPASDEQISRPWMLWNRSFEIAPEASTRFARAVANNRTTNHPGFYLRAFSAAWAHTTNELFLRAIERLLEPYKHSIPGITPSFEIDCDGCARLLPENLADRLRALASRDDCATNNDPKTAMMFVSRYQNTGNIRYRDAMLAAASARLDSSPEGLSPETLGHDISLQLAAWRSNARQAHLDKARACADIALTKYFDGTPRLTPGTDTLALALVELHLHILHITAVRCPPNTIDR